MKWNIGYTWLVGTLLLSAGLGELKQSYAVFMIAFGFSTLAYAVIRAFFEWVAGERR